MTGRSATQPGRGKTVLTYILLGIWVVLISFGALSTLDPEWLQELSSRGIAVESRGAKEAGDTLLRQGQYGRAIALYEHALKIRPDYIGAMVNLAIAYRQLGAAERGERLLRDALREGRGERGVIAFNLAELLEKQGKTDEALRYYRQAIDSSVQQDRLHEKLGTVHFAAGAYKEALEAFEKSLQIRMDPVASYRNMLHRSLSAFEDDSTNLAIIEEQLDREWSAADLAPYDLEVILGSLHADREIARNHTCLGIVYSRMGEPARAVEHLEKALAITPDDRDAAENLREQKALLGGRGASPSDR